MENQVNENQVEKKEEGQVGTKLAPEVQKALENTDAEKVEESKEVVVKPNLFVRGDEEIKIEVDVIYGKNNGEIMSVVTSEVDLDLEKVKVIFGHMRLSFTFTQPTYDKLSRYRERSTQFDSDSRTNVLNQLKMRDFFIIYHLKDWNVTNDEDEKIELKFEPNGTLSDESIDEVYRLHPSVLDVVITAFERKMLLMG